VRSPRRFTPGSSMPSSTKLRASERLHEVFTELSVAGASLDEVVRQAAALAGRPVILADLSHRVLAASRAAPIRRGCWAGFARRSRALSGSSGAPPTTRRPGGCSRRSGRGARIGAGHPSLRRAARRHGHRADRAGGDHAGPRPPATRHAESLDRQAHRTLITGIISQAHADPARRRAVQGARGTGGRAAARRHGAQAARSGRHARPARGLGPRAVLDVADAAAAACPRRADSSPGRTLDDARAGAMLSLSPSADPDRVLESLAARLGSGRDGLVIRGRRRGRFDQGCAPLVPRASQVADVAAERPGEWLPGRQDRPPSTGWLTCACAAWCTCSGTTRGCRRSWSASWARCSPPSRTHRCSTCSPRTSLLAETRRRRQACAPGPADVYERLRRIERILGTDLDSAESRTSCTWRCWPWKPPETVRPRRLTKNSR